MKADGSSISGGYNMSYIQPVSLPEIFPSDSRQRIRKLLQEEFAVFRDKIIVLDDDPTGIQTVHGVSVYTDWSIESFRSGFAEKNNLFFILTNSRSFTAEKTAQVHTEIAENIAQVSAETGKSFILISRGDSTLRGHYPLETGTLRDTLYRLTHRDTDFEVIVPFFPEGNRFTLGDIHYIRQGQELIPVGESEFAKDKTFGYRSSDLKAWCEEKSGGRIRAEDVVSITLDDTRTADIGGIEKKLLGIHDFGKVIINAAEYADLEVFCVALLRVLRQGRRCMLRSAAAMVKVLGNISDKPLLTARDLIQPEVRTGGIVLVGSHVRKTTVQLEALRLLPQVHFIEFNQHRVLEKDGLEDEVRKTTAAAEKLIAEGTSVAVYTRRERIDFPGNDPEKNLAMAVSISDAVTSIIGNLTVRPAFIVAKGGITSSDVGTRALKVKKALVMGQIAPGVPVWQTGPESKFPYMPYVIFPGNVGDEHTLKDVVSVLLGG